MGSDLAFTAPQNQTSRISTGLDVSTWGRISRLSSATKMVLTYKRAVAHTLVDFSTPGILEWEDVPVVAPKRDEVLIRVKAVALNPIDHKKSLGADFAKVPVNPCSDVSGTVVALGPNTKGTFSIGDE